MGDFKVCFLRRKNHGGVKTSLATANQKLKILKCTDNTTMRRVVYTEYFKRTLSVYIGKTQQKRGEFNAAI